MKYPVVLVLLLFMTGVSLSSCGHHATTSTPSRDSLAAGDSSAAKDQFFPVDDYLEAEILSVDSTPMAFWKYVTHGNRTDSTLITTGDFNTLALQFLPPEIRNGGLNKNFTENSFADRATESITFTYTPTDKTNPLQRVDVLTRRGVRAQEVKSIYMERTHSAGDSVILQRLLWRAKHGFTIINQVRVKGQAPKDEQVRVSWASDQED